MKTVGIDLASDPRKTGWALIVWGAGRAVVQAADVGADDARVLALHGQADAIGLDAPFGWPLGFVEFVAGHGVPDGSASAPAPGAWGAGARDRLRFRETDHVVRQITRRWPLSVSSDLIAVPAFRCIGLLAQMGVTDRGGDGRVFETYPAVALKRWGLADTGYKGRAKRDRLSRLVDALLAAAPWLAVPAEIEARMRRCDDVFDAVVAAMIARAARLGHDGSPGLVEPPTPEQRAKARAEGWIIVPVEGGLSRLLGPDGAGGGA